MRTAVLLWVLAISTLSAQTVKFGFVLPLGILHGQSYRDCARMAKEDFGPTDLDFDFIFEDNNYEVARTNLVAQKFLSVDRVDVVWSVWGMFANVVEPLAARKDVLHVTSAFDFDVDEGSNSLNGAPQNEAEVRLLLDYLRAHQLKRLGLVYIQESGLLSWISKLKAMAPAYGIEIVSDQMILEKERDLRMVVMRAQSAKLDALWLDLWEPPLPIFVRQAKELGLDIPLISRDDAYATPELAAMFEGEVGISSALPGADWVERFKQEYGYVPISYAWIYYEQVRSVMEAYEQIFKQTKQVATPQQIKECLVGRRYAHGPLGEVYYDAQGRLVNEPSVIRIVEGQVVPFEESLAQ